MRDLAPSAGSPGSPRTAWRLLALIVAVALLYPAWIGHPDTRWATYCLIEVVAVVATWWLSWRRRAPLAWYLLLAGITCNVIADLMYYRETVVVGMGAKAALSDVFYTVAYFPLAAGLVALGRRVGRTTGALLDASIFAIGLAVPVATFYMVPAARAVPFGVEGILLVGLYAFGSILLFALYVHQATSRRGSNPAFLVLGAALLMAALGDPLWNVHMLGGNPALAELPKLFWYLNRCLPLAAVAHPAITQVWRFEPEAPSSPLPRVRLVALILGSLMPALTLVLASLAEPEHPYWIPIAGGGILLPLLVLVRMDGLLLQLRRQARQLDVLSHYDELTGAPNRRQWKRALATAVAQARLDGRPLTLALLDLDHFKAFNDTHGHHAGDNLLRDAYRTWSARLPPEAVLARYGGEEFALLLPGFTVAEAVPLVEALQPHTPQWQSFSAGVAPCEVSDDLDSALDRADAALYSAKQSGRRRVLVAGD